jgi:hypothetical protein
MSTVKADRFVESTAGKGVTIEDLNALGLLDAFSSEAERDDYFATHDLKDNALALVEATGTVHRYNQVDAKWHPQFRTRTGGPEIAATNRGAKGDDGTGNTDNTAAGMQAQADAGPWGVARSARVTWDAGVYRVTGHLILSAHNVADSGAMFKPMAPFGMVSVTGFLDADHPCFDYSGGGVVEHWTRQHLLNFRKFGIVGSGLVDDSPALNRYLEACYGLWHPVFVPSASTNGSVTRAGANYIPGIYVGYRLEVISGTGAGQYRTITANTSTVISWSLGGGAGNGALVLDGTSNVRIAARHGFTGSTFNHPFIVGPGVYRCDGKLNHQVVVGYLTKAAGKLSSTFVQNGVNTTLWDMDATCYGDFEDMGIRTDAAQNITSPQIENDWSGNFPDTLKTQQQNFRRLSLNGQRLGWVGLRIARHGGSAVSGSGGTQGDTITLKDITRISFLRSWLSLGSTEFTSAQNCLDIQIKGGDTQDCLLYGMESTALSSPTRTEAVRTKARVEWRALTRSATGAQTSKSGKPLRCARQLRSTDRSRRFC